MSTSVNESLLIAQLATGKGWQSQIVINFPICIINK